MYWAITRTINLHRARLPKGSVWAKLQGGKGSSLKGFTLFWSFPKEKRTKVRNCLVNTNRIQIDDVAFGKKALEERSKSALSFFKAKQGKSTYLVILPEKGKIHFNN